MNQDRTARFDLPYLHAGQAQKELHHNEALSLIDLALHPAVEAVGVNAPPADPADGSCWIVGPEPTGVFAGHPGALAGWTGGGWRFVSPRPGFAIWSIADGMTARWDGTAWRTGALSVASVNVAGRQVVGPRQSAIGTPAGGATTDVEARAAIAAILTALRSHGLIAND